jgi:hypothetical protein
VLMADQARFRGRPRVKQSLRTFSILTGRDEAAPDAGRLKSLVVSVPNKEGDWMLFY